MNYYLSDYRNAYLFLMGIFLFSCVQTQTPVNNNRTYKDEKLSDPEYRLKLTEDYEMQPRQSFELLKPGGLNACTRNSFATGLSSRCSEM